MVKPEAFDVPSAGSVITGAVMVIVSLLVAGSIMTRGHRHLAIASWDTMVDASLRVFLKNAHVTSQHPKCHARIPSENGNLVRLWVFHFNRMATLFVCSAMNYHMIWHPLGDSS